MNSDPSETSDSTKSKKSKANAGWNIHAVVDRLDTLALFAMASILAASASFYCYKFTFFEDRSLTFASFIAIIGAILFYYKWVQNQVLKGMTDNVMETIKAGFDNQNKKLDDFEVKIDKLESKFDAKFDKVDEKFKALQTEMSKFAQDLAYIRGRLDQVDLSSKNTKKSETDF